MSARDLGAALVASLDDETVRALAERLRPYLEGRPDRRPLLTPAQAAERLSLHPKTVVRMARDGRLPAVKVGTGWRFDPDRIVIAPSIDAEPASVAAIRGSGKRSVA